MTRFKNITLGGEFAISYKIGAYALPILILTVPLTSIAESSNGTFLQWSIAALAGTILAVIGLFAVDKTIWANRRLYPVSNRQLFLVGGLIGALKGLATEIFATKLFSITGISISTIFERTISSASIGAISIPLIALLGFSINARQQIKDKRLNDLAGIDNLLEGLDNKLIEEKFLEDTRNRIENARESFEKEFIQSRNYNNSDIANKLNQIATDLVRPLSHRAEQLNKRSVLEEHSWSETVSRFPSAVKLGVGWLLTLYVASSARLQLQIRGLAGGTIILTITTLIFLVSLNLFFSLNRKKMRGQYFVFASLLGSMILNSTLAFVASEIVFGDYKVNFSLNVFWCFLISVVVGFSTLYLTYEIEDLAHLNEEYSKKFQQLLKLEQGTPRISANLARYLHGTMQTRLIASAYRLQNLSEQSTIEEIEAELQLVLEHLTLPENVSSFQKVNTSKDMIHEIIELWGTFMEISTNFQDLHLIDIKTMGNVCELLNEALSNAFRHGRASNVTVEIRVEGNKVNILVSDNGFISQEPKPGLGMSLYDRVTSNWELNRVGGSTILQGTFAIQN